MPSSIAQGSLSVLLGLALASATGQARAGQRGLPAPTEADAGAPGAGEPAEGEDLPASNQVVLMAPDLPEQEIDEHLIARVRAAAEESEATVHVVRYDPTGFDPATVVERSRRRAAERTADAVLWLDLRGPEALALYLFEVRGDRVLGRRVPLDPEAPAVAHEALANIASSVVAESLEGPVAGLAELDPQTLEEPAPEPEPEPEPPPPEPEPEPPPPEPEPEPPPPEPPPLRFPRLLLSLGYTGQSFSNDPLLGHGLLLAAAWSPAPRAFVGLRYDLVLPLSLDEPAFGLELRRHPVSIEGGYRFGVGRRWDLEAMGRFTLDPIRRITDPRSTLGPTRDDWRLFSAGALGLGAGVSPLPELRVGLRLGAEVLTSRADYAVQDPQTRVVVSPHPVRGFVELHLGFATLWRPKKK